LLAAPLAQDRIPIVLWYSEYLQLDGLTTASAYVTARVTADDAPASDLGIFGLLAFDTFGSTNYGPLVPATAKSTEYRGFGSYDLRVDQTSLTLATAVRWALALQNYDRADRVVRIQLAGIVVAQRRP